MIFMHRKAVFFIAGVFLVVALVVPPVLLILQSDHDLDNFIIAQNPNGLQTNGNITITDEIGENNQSTYTIAAVIEVVFVSLFAVTMYYGINHRHPEH
jgi:hypothetical protein